MLGCYTFNVFKKEAEPFIECYRKKHAVAQPTDWECLLAVNANGVRLLVLIYTQNTGRVLETRTFLL